jgi:hypothetical protein
MGELHKFKDDVRTAEGKRKAISAKALDNNFQVVRLRVSSSLAALLRVKDNSPQADSLELAATSGTFILTIQNGALSLVTVPNDSTQFLNGALTFTTTQVCP